MNDREHTATREQIEACTDIATLVRWFDDADDMAVNIAATITAREASDISDDEWFFRSSDKYAFCRQAMHRIQKRLYRLGYEGRLVPSEMERV